MLGKRGQRRGALGGPLQAGGGDAGEAAPGEQEPEEQSASVQRALRLVPRVRAAAEAPPAPAGRQGGHHPRPARQPGPAAAPAAGGGRRGGGGGRGAGAGAGPLAGGEPAGAAGAGQGAAEGQPATLGAENGSSEPGKNRGCPGAGGRAPGLSLGRGGTSGAPTPAALFPPSSLEKN